MVNSMKLFSFFFISVGLLIFSTGNVNAAECKPATINFVFRDSSNQYISGITVNVFEQKTDADGKPAPGKKIAEGKTLATTGIAEVKFTPSIQSDNIYAFKVFDKNSEAGAFWFYDNFSIGCGESESVIKKLSSITFVFRNDLGELKKNVKFSLYTQRYDVDRQPINEKEDLVYGNFDTSIEGKIVTYVADKTHTAKGVGGDYILTADLGSGVGYIETAINVSAGANFNYEYIFSDVAITMEDAEANLLEAGKSVEIFEQDNNIKGDRIIVKSVKKLDYNKKGQIIFENSAGVYAMVLKDSFGQKDVFWDVVIEKNKRTEKKIVSGISRIYLPVEMNKLLNINRRITLYSLTKDNKGNFYRDKKIGNLNISDKGYAEAHIAPGNYLIVYSNSTQKEYGGIYEIEQSKLQEVTLKNVEVGKIIGATVNSGNQNSSGSVIGNLLNKLKGYILLQVESLGEAWYVGPEKRYYLKDGDSAFEIMNNFGLGIKNKDLNKIPVGIIYDPAEKDFDSDGLSDKLEKAIGTDPNNFDTDGDGYNDSEEVENGYDPNGKNKLPVDKKINERLKGKILLQVESLGEAWYVNIKDGKRYYMANGNSAFNIMKNMGVGITNDNLNKIKAE
ncbi:MAG: Thrombospondin type 3 repeat superfamily protein [Parcubacteria group bacterium GW2011_GWE2_38_18]|nr:MAG: Thrombospondin type 3 repeat superfamily protein [Parcubacteria group bacterium GW2011_GWE2_38_18]